jgi:micrococcal nuclease
MWMRILACALLLTFPLACEGTHAGGPAGSDATVEHVSDGDTIVLADGRHVRLVQIDAPEQAEHECYAEAASRALESMLPPGTEVALELDPELDHVDRFGRTLAYVEKDGVNVNLELVRRGAAAPYFYRGDRGRYAAQLLDAARAARENRKGLWGACPRTRLDPLSQVRAAR